MAVVNIIIILVFFFSFVGGLIEGAVKSFFSLLSFIIAIPIAGQFYPFVANWLSFLPGRNWENFIAFFIVLVSAGILLSFVFYYPRKLMEETWKVGFLSRVIGGILNLVSAAIGVAVFALVLFTYPIVDWLLQAVSGSPIVEWLILNLDFIRGLLPDPLVMNVFLLP
jgi:membrane protein required for colicin V production